MPARIGNAARQRILGAHTAACRAAELESYLMEAVGRRRAAQPLRREAVAV
jgi:hypothetical protein